MKGEEVAELLETIANLLDFLGENPFKSRAYRKAAHFIEGIDDIKRFVEEGKLSKIKGVGSAIESKVREYIEKGNISYLEELKKDLPDTILELFSVPGLGPKRVRVLYDKLGISSLSELEYACLENRLVTLPGFGEKSQKKILKGIELLKKRRENFLLSTSLDAFHSISQRLKDILLTGDLRRCLEVVKGVDIIVEKGEGVKIPDLVKDIADLRTSGDRIEGVHESGVRLRFFLIDKERIPVALQRTTGNDIHNKKLSSLALEKGYEFKNFSILKKNKEILVSREEEIYDLLGIQYIPPELREGLDEVDMAMDGKIPELVTERDLGGIIHVHTIYSDGRNTIEELAEEVIKMGYRYIGIADHSKSAYYAGGLKEDDIRRQHEEIDKLNEKYKERGFRIYKGIESDILPDGSLDYEDNILESFDFVIASVHSHFNMSKDEMTKRIIKALSHPRTTILGHPTGRLLLGRDGYQVDLDEVLMAAKEMGKALELNANPMRLDLDWRWLRKAKNLGVKIAIDPDAHNISGLYDIKYGVMIARKGWLEKKDLFFLDEGKGS